MVLPRRPRLLCLLCQWRGLSTSTRRLAEQASKTAAKQPASTGAVPTPPRFIAPSPLGEAPRAYGKRLETFTPQPLSRPIGLPYPPLPGENTGLDFRSIQQRRDDFVNYDKHLERRKQLKNKISRPYFRDWGNMSFHKGKTFVSPPRLFRRDLSLYFPNLFGQTLLKTDREPRDTTPTLAGKVSVVALFSSVWAENQANSFVSPENNPALHERLQAHGVNEGSGPAQLVRINVEEDSLKAALIKLFIGGLRKRIGEANWDKYFVVRKGISDEIREGIGLLNSKVGYVYLLDGDCRIRWAGSGPSEEAERDSLNKGLQRLLEEERASSNKAL